MDEAQLLEILVDTRILSNFKICAPWLCGKWHLTMILICISQITKEDKQLINVLLILFSPSMTCSCLCLLC